MAVVAWAVSLGIELIYIRDHLEGGDAYRMNTVFKFGFQIWVLLALAAAAALPWLVRRVRRMGVVAEIIGGAALTLLIAMALVFPLVGTPSRLATRFPEHPGPAAPAISAGASDRGGSRVGDAGRRRHTCPSSAPPSSSV